MTAFLLRVRGLAVDWIGGPWRHGVVARCLLIILHYNEWRGCKKKEFRADSSPIVPGVRVIPSCLWHILASSRTGALPLTRLT